MKIQMKLIFSDVDDGVSLINKQYLFQRILSRLSVTKENLDMQDYVGKASFLILLPFPHGHTHRFHSRLCRYVPTYYMFHYFVNSFFTLR